MPVPNTFANATATIPLSQLDANFATTITLGNTAIQLGNTVTTLNNMTLANVNISSGIVTITNATVTTANVTTANIATAEIANVTVSGTGTFAAGSNTAPSITTSGDTNTGIFFPAADTVAIGTGGTERLRVDSAGNAGLGVTPSAWGGYKSIDITSGGSVFGFATNYAGLSSNAYNDGTGWKYKNTAVASLYQLETNTHVWYNAPSGTAGNAITFTQAMTIDANGNLMIAGATSAVGQLTIGGTGNIYCNGGATWYTGGALFIRAGVSGVLHLGSNDINSRAVLNTNGEFLVGSATDQGAYNIQCNGTGVWGAAAYVNGSDERIKENIAPITSGLDVVTKMNPVTYRYKESWSKDQSIQTGFIAQELLVAMEGKNYVDGVVQQGGSEGYYSVAYQNIIPLLTKAIQELNAKVEAQAAEIAALKGAA